jgi:hypothetical protein
MLAVPELAHAADLFNVCQFQAMRDIAEETARAWTSASRFFRMLPRWPSLQPVGRL